MRVKAMMPVLPRSWARLAAARRSLIFGVSLGCSAESRRGSSFSVVAAMRAITSTGAPDAVKAAHASVKRLTDLLKSQFVTTLNLSVPQEGAADND